MAISVDPSLRFDFLFLFLGRLNQAVEQTASRKIDTNFILAWDLVERLLPQRLVSRRIVGHARCRRWGEARVGYKALNGGEIDHKGGIQSRNGSDGAQVGCGLAVVQEGSRRRAKVGSGAQAGCRVALDDSCNLWYQVGSGAGTAGGIKARGRIEARGRSGGGRARCPEGRN